MTFASSEKSTGLSAARAGSIAGERVANVACREFVDIHTHYDGQVTWDAHLTPSCWHGVTTIVMGNCGVGFAPVKPGEHDFLIQLMEGVEDIPGHGARRRHPVGVGDLPRVHGRGRARPARAGRRRAGPARRRPDLRDGRTRRRTTSRRRPKTSSRWLPSSGKACRPARSASRPRAPSCTRPRAATRCRAPSPPRTSSSASAACSASSARASSSSRRSARPGEDVIGAREEMKWMRRLSAEIGRPVSFAMLQVDAEPTLWKELLDESVAGRRRRRRRIPAGRRPPVRHADRAPDRVPPLPRPADLPGAADLPFDERIAKLRDPATRAQILSEKVEYDDPMAAFVMSSFHKLFPLGPDCPTTSRRPRTASRPSPSARASPPKELLYDMMLAAGRPRAAALPAAQLQRRQLRRDLRDAPPPARRAGAGRRRRALRDHLRREHPDLHALALGARPASRICLVAEGETVQCNAGGGPKPDIRRCCRFRTEPAAAIFGVARRIGISRDGTEVVDLAVEPTASNASIDRLCDVPTCADDRASGDAVLTLRGTVKSKDGAVEFELPIALDGPLGLRCTS